MSNVRSLKYSKIDMIGARLLSRVSSQLKNGTNRAGIRPLMSDPTLADAILDRLVHNGYKIKMEGESMRKHYANLT